MPEQRRDFRPAQPRRNRSFDDAAEPLVVEAFEDVGDQARRACADSRLLLLAWGLQEMADGAGDVDVAHSARDDRRDQEIFLEEARERLTDTVLVARDDRGVRDWEAKRMAEQRGDREPVGKSAHHCGFGERFDVAEPRILRLERASGGEHGSHHHQQPGGDDLHPLRSGLRRVEAG